MLKKTKVSAEEWVFQDSKQSSIGTMASESLIQTQNHTMDKDNKKISLILEMI